MRDGSAGLLGPLRKAERIERPREAGESVAPGVLKSRLGVSGGRRRCTAE